MWLWRCELHRLGFRQRSENYWQCATAYGLPDDTYLSIWVQAVQRGPEGQELLEVSAFHVTFLLDVDRVHFYFHEVEEHVWEPGGHTSSIEIRRHHVEPHDLRAEADAIASRLVQALQANLQPRE